MRFCVCIRPLNCKEVLWSMVQMLSLLCPWYKYITYGLVAGKSQDWNITDQSTENNNFHSKLATWSLQKPAFWLILVDNILQWVELVTECWKSLTGLYTLDGFDTENRSLERCDLSLSPYHFSWDNATAFFWSQWHLGGYQFPCQGREFGEGSKQRPD